METTDYGKLAVGKFQEYLRQHKLRKTPERFAILEAIYSADGHFSLEELHQKMVDECHFVVSRATVYNTVNMLVDAGLIVRHRLAEKAEYEKAVVTGSSHFHLICNKCGSIRELHNDKLMRALSEIKTGRFSAESYTLYVYGTCARCNSAINRKNKKKETKNKI